MPPTIHFYDSQYIGAPASGQLVSFDSLSLTGGQVASYQTKITLRPDVAFWPQSIEQGDCFALDMANGISEYEWSRKAHDLFSAQDSLHVGIGNTGTLDSFMRFALYRCLSLLPNTTQPAGAHYLDLLTVCRALNLLRPDSMPVSLPNQWSEQRKREFLFNCFPGDSRADSVKEFAKCITAASPKLMAHAIGHSSPEMIGNLCGLVDGQVESLAELKPVFLCHEQLLDGRGYGVFLALGTDPQYRNIVYMIDLQADLTALVEDRGSDVSRFIRRDASQQDRPVVRVNLNRVPFASPLGVIDRSTASRLGIDASAVKRNAALLIDKVDICLALHEVSGASEASLNADPDFQLYGAEYLPADRELLDQLHRVDATHWQSLITTAQDARITTLGQRLIRRCAPALLSEGDADLWLAHCAGRLLGKSSEARIAETKAYCNNIASSNAYPLGMRTAAQHWLHTTEIGNEFRNNV
ncbi:exodeoxyribonuclease I [Pseudomonas putida]|uniref:hypothetical protein n=1 Tax=Pseudomonas putida TaxID=303 RepID=UPI002364004C|nr:hypothetical protein [Pseudomonas putida]MDD2139641.1 exodeoxyribonuclease I [Pseudomonas putida]HDS1721564.1 exodeoxyribonuclease I [Pseudomonas putida]